MIGTTLRRHRAGAIAIAAMLLTGATTYAVAQQKSAAAESRLQEIADNAALAGVNALAASEGQPDATRLEAVNAAVNKAIASRSDITTIVAPSIDGLRVSVAVSTSNRERGAALTATARYIQPGSAVSPGQTADAVSRKRTRG